MVKVKQQWAREHVYFSDVEISSKIWLPMSTWRYVGPSVFIGVCFASTNPSFLLCATIGNLFRTKNDLFMRLYEVSMARNYFDFGSASYDVGSGDAFHDHTAWHTHQTRATLQHRVHICDSSQNCRIQTTRE